MWVSSKNFHKSFNIGRLFELLIILSDNFNWEERGEVSDIKMRNISVTKLREKTFVSHFVCESKILIFLAARMNLTLK